MRSLVVRLLALAIAAALMTPSIAEGQRRRARRGPPSGSGGPSAPAEPDPDAEARALFEAGREAFDAGYYDTALDQFTRAYALSGRPGLLFNIASTAERLRRDDEALRAYEAYLAALPDAPNREYAQSRVVFLEEQARLRAAPSGASVATAPDADAAASEPARDVTAIDVEGEDEDVAALRSPVDAAAVSAAPARTEARRDVTQEWWFWTIIGVAVVGTGAGIAGAVAAADASPSGPPVRGDFGPGGVIVALEGL